MRWWDNLSSRYRWTWVGTVEGVCHLVDEKGARTPGGNISCYWNLFERGDGKRRFSVIGRVPSSQAAKVSQAGVEAWRLGAPMPALYRSPTPEKPKPQLIAFPGGKDGAA